MHARAEIIARGQVQRVGYRDEVERAARDLELTGYVQNVKPYDVRIVCEGERSALDSFVEQIRITTYPIEVKDLAIRFEPATGEFEYFEIKRGDMAEELGERLDLPRTDMTKMIGKQDAMLGKMDVMIGKQDLMVEKQDTMLGKMDVMIEKQDLMVDKQDTMLGKMDVMIEKQDLMITKQEETITVIKEEGEKTRSVMKGTLEEEIAWVKDEIMGLKATLNKVKQKVGVD
ncbi:MAG: acylphosphatase [Candidatus Methanospirareceae archaeon]